jgi:DNA-binding XRE family transcriptional regulator
MEIDMQPKTLRQWRQELLISQMDLSKVVGASQGSISSWERGVSAPKISLKRRVAEAMKREWGIPRSAILWPIEKERMRGASATSVVRVAS